MPAITPLQMRLARAATGMGVRDLAKAAEVSPTTVTRFESGRAGVHASTLARLQAVLEAAGVVFVPGDTSGGPTVRLRS